MEDEGDHGADSKREALRDGCSKSQTIDKVVDGISKDDDPGQRLHLNGTMLTRFISLHKTKLYIINTSVM